MELFVINTYLSLLIFNPLEAAVLFLAATGDFKLVFSRKFIKHWFVLGTINFVFQYTVNLIPIGIINLLYSYLNSIFLISFVLYYYLNIILKIKINKINIFLATLFNLISVLFILLVTKDFVGFICVPSNFSIIREILVNFVIKIFQFLLLYIFWRVIYEKFCKENVNF